MRRASMGVWPISFRLTRTGRPGGVVRTVRTPKVASRGHRIVAPSPTSTVSVRSAYPSSFMEMRWVPGATMRLQPLDVS